MTMMPTGRGPPKKLAPVAGQEPGGPFDVLHDTGWSSPN